MQLDWQVAFDVCRHCHALPRSVSCSCFVELCIWSELLAVVSQPVVCWSCSAEVCLLLLGTYSFAFHECMLFIAIASFNTYFVIIVLKFATFVCQMLWLHTHRCTTVTVSWVHVSYFVCSHSHACRWVPRFELWMDVVVCFWTVPLSDLRAWMVCLWRWQCWCNTTSPPVTATTMVRTADLF